MNEEDPTRRELLEELCDDHARGMAPEDRAVVEALDDRALALVLRICRGVAEDWFYRGIVHAEKQRER